ncbi:MAG TPA: hypothetical protein VFA83_25365 [Acidimicrobiales bacterium]|nr:hypothetical protein [Acidimicrobiales bacterium]
MRSSKVWPAALLALGVAVTACGGGPKSPSVPALPSTGAGQATNGAQAGGASSATTPLAKAEAYAECMRSHGVTNFPDPVVTPSGGYGFRTRGVDPNSSAFRLAGAACNALAPEGWGTSGQELSPAQQQEWLNWAKCIRAHGVPDFADPTFSSGGAVHIDGGGAGGISPQLQSAMDACHSQMPSAGGLGG